MSHCFRQNLPILARRGSATAGTGRIGRGSAVFGLGSGKKEVERVAVKALRLLDEAYLDLQSGHLFSSGVCGAGLQEKTGLGQKTAGIR